MGKKRIVTKSGQQIKKEAVSRTLSKLPKKKIASGTFYIQSTFNNTKIALTDNAGNVIAWSSTGVLGFKGAKKGTPFAASKVAEIMVEKAQAAGLKEARVVVKGVGAGRESSIRTIAARGIDISAIEDATPIPHNGPRPRKPRRV